jgi:diguanylate cyclase (GGDEF)-like protein/PAS domain S-box-containing protein
LQTTRPPHAAGPDSASVYKDRLHDLRASVSAVAALRRTLDVSGESQLFSALGRLLRNVTSSLHTFVLARAGASYQVAAYKSRDKFSLDPARVQQDAERALAGLEAGMPDCVELGGLPCVVVPLSANGRRVLGALCLAMADDTYMDIAALTALAASGASQLQRLRDAAEAKARAERLRHELHLHSAVADEGGILRTIIDNMPDQIYAKDANGRFIVGNKAAAIGIFGVPNAEALIGKSDLDFYPIECGQRFFTDEQQIIRSGVPIVDQIEANINNDGVQRFFSTTKYPFHDEKGEIIGIVGISRDVTARINADEAVRLRDRAVESSQDGILITCCTTPGHPVVYCNPAFERITGFSLAEAQAAGIERFIVDEGEGAAPRERGALIARQGERRVIHATRKDGREYWCEVRLAVIRTSDGAATHNVFTLVDVTAAQHAEQQLTLLASHDPLTGLPNRRMLMERLGQAVSVSERGGMELAVAFLDLDGLKRLNDEHGHEAGDVLLKTVAERIAGCIRQSDTIARLGGDEFVLVTLHRADEDTRGGVAEVLAKVQEQIGRPIQVGAVEVKVSCSIGVSVYRHDGALPEMMLRRADEAMYVAKKSGRNRVVFHDV